MIRNWYIKYDLYDKKALYGLVKLPFMGKMNKYMIKRCGWVGRERAEAVGVKGRAAGGDCIYTTWSCCSW